MQTFYCSHCGAPIESNLRFCRKCGHAVNISEATTRTLDPPPVVEPATQHINSMPTAPSYLPPEMMQPLAAQPTRDLRQDGQKRTVVILASLVGFLLIALIALGIISFWISRSTNSGPGRMTPPPPPSAATQPPGGAAPPGGIIIPHPPQPPIAPTAPPSTVGGASAIARDMIYPGAEINMEMNRAEGSSVMQLRTNDSFDKVVAWYTAKLRPTKAMNTPGPTAILRAEGFSAIITGAAPGEGVHIVLKQERGKE